VAGTGAATVALVHEDSAFGGPGAATAQAILEDAGLEVPLREAFTSTLSGGSGDFRAAITRARSSEAEMLYWIGYDGDVVPMHSQVRELGYQPQYIFGAPPGWPTEFAQSPEAECATGLIGYLPNLPNPEAGAFLNAFQAMHNTSPDNYMSALAYANLWALADAINTAGTTDQAALINALEEGTFRSPMGDWSFTDSVITSHQGFGAEMWLVFQYQNGTREIVYPSHLATAPLATCF